MSFSWYSIIISAQSGGAIFNGFFSVDNYTNLVTRFYDLALPINNSYTDVILPTTDEASYYQADNIYPFDDNGLNFYSTALQNFFNISQNHFNIYNLDNVDYLYTDATDDLSYPAYPAYEILIQPITGPITCFIEGSKILTNKGYISIQDLRKGDLVKTFKHDYKAIDMIGKKEIYHPALQERIKDQLYQCSKDNFDEIFEPLIITGCHSILVDSFTDEEQIQKVIEVNGNIYVTDKKYRLPACVDPRASVYKRSGIYTIYHIALENDDYYMNYGIYANGLLVETCSKRYLKELSNMNLIE